MNENRKFGSIAKKGANTEISRDSQGITNNVNSLILYIKQSKIHVIANIAKKFIYTLKMGILREFYFLNTSLNLRLQPKNTLLEAKI